jgi:hypothetical protein
LLVLRAENQGNSVDKQAARKLRDRFLAWQCRIRQEAVRQEGGRPSSGMRPRVLDKKGNELAAALTVLLVPSDPEESTAFFRYQVMRSPDPRETYARALGYLQADYFQKPKDFSDKLLAVLPSDSTLAEALIGDGACYLAFEQYQQSYRLPCAVRELKRGDAFREAAIWHNRLFNPALPDKVHIVAFKPDWSSATSR